MNRICPTHGNFLLYGKTVNINRCSWKKHTAKRGRVASFRELPEPPWLTTVWVVLLWTLPLFRACFPERFPHQTMDYDYFIKSQLASRNSLQRRMWCKFGHVTLKVCEVTLVFAGQTYDIPPGHDMWVVGDSEAIVIEFDQPSI